MPKMISLRSFRLASRSGFITHVKANEPFECPLEALQEAMTAGCAPVNSADLPIYMDAGEAKRDVHGSLRESLIHVAIDSIVRENKVKDFDASNTPKLSVVNDRLGIDVTAKELHTAYQRYQTVQANKEDPNLHPDTVSLMQVIDATTTEELLKHVEAMGDDPAKYAGLNMRALRRAVIGKFAGSGAFVV